jgi:hypothetical protein
MVCPEEKSFHYLDFVGKSLGLGWDKSELYLVGKSLVFGFKALLVKIFR